LKQRFAESLTAHCAVGARVIGKLRRHSRQTSSACTWKLCNCFQVVWLYCFLIIPHFFIFVKERM